LGGLNVNQMFLYQRPTIGQSIDTDATAAVGSIELVVPGLYHVVNLGPNIAYIKTFSADHTVHTVTISAMAIFPCIAPWFHTTPQCIQIGMRDVKSVTTGLGGGHPSDLNFLHHICDTGCTATLRITRVTKN